MPYKITAERDQQQFTAIVAKKRLPHVIIKNLVALKLTLTDLTTIVQQSQANPLMIVSETDFTEMVAQQPCLDMIYESIVLHNNSRIYYHTNWTVGQNSWQLMTQQLDYYHIKVSTIEGPDPSITFKEIIDL